MIYLENVDQSDYFIQIYHTFSIKQNGILRLINEILDSKIDSKIENVHWLSLALAK